MKHFCVIDTETSTNGNVQEVSLMFTRQYKDEIQLLGSQSFIIAEYAMEPRFSQSLSALPELLGLVTKENYKLVSISEVNNVLKNAVKKGYALGSYNWAFDNSALVKSGVIIPECPTFCLMNIANGVFSNLKEYRMFCIQNGLITQSKNAISMKLETIGKFLGIEMKQTHTARSDLVDFTLPVFQDIVKRFPRSWKNKKREYDNCKLENIVGGK